MGRKLLQSERRDVYEVESYDMWDAPAERTHLRHGRFEVAGDALAVARAVVEKSLRDHLGSAKSAAGLRSSFSSYGEVPMIFGEPRVEFDPFRYADEVAPIIFAEVRPGPKE